MEWLLRKRLPGTRRIGGIGAAVLRTELLGILAGARDLGLGTGDWGLGTGVGTWAVP